MCGLCNSLEGLAKSWFSREKAAYDAATVFFHILNSHISLFYYMRELLLCAATRRWIGIPLEENFSSYSVITLSAAKGLLCRS